MKQSSIKTLKSLCYAALVVVALGLIFLCFQSYFILTTGSGPGVINWDSPRIGLKLAIFIAQRVSILVLMGLFVAFVVNILKYLRDGQIFNRTNVRLMWALSVAVPIYAFLCDNVGQACSATNELNVALSSDFFVYTLIVLIVAQLYKVAYDTAQEQQLTI
ncbi:MAG: hypothetical protein IJV05_08710 [Muribaculaceae bacterium]|nr:hypothetical protein [Muribaculaceae bacterium]